MEPLTIVPVIVDASIVVAVIVTTSLLYPGAQEYMGKEITGVLVTVEKATEEEISTLELTIEEILETGVGVDTKLEVTRVASEEVTIDVEVKETVMGVLVLE